MTLYDSVTEFKWRTELVLLPGLQDLTCMDTQLSCNIFSHREQIMQQDIVSITGWFIWYIPPWTRIKSLNESRFYFRMWPLITCMLEGRNEKNICHHLTFKKFTDAVVTLGVNVIKLYTNSFTALSFLRSLFFFIFSFFLPASSRFQFHIMQSFFCKKGDIVGILFRLLIGNFWKIIKWLL